MQAAQTRQRSRRVLLYTVKETGELLRRSPHTIRRWVKVGSLEGFALGNGLTHISAASIRAFLKRHSLSPRVPSASVDPAQAPSREEIEQLKGVPGQIKT